MLPVMAVRWLVACVWLWCVPAIASAATPAEHAGDKLPAISLIIDDLGNQRVQGERVVLLPGPVACAFLPHAPFTASQARQAHASNKEVMLHLPMQAVANGASDNQKGVLTLDMTQRQFTETLVQGLESVPHVSGLNNHMGSLLTRHPGHMAWLMRLIRQRGELFFVDSRTTRNTVAKKLAREYGIPATARSVFLDNQHDRESIRAKFRELVKIAHRKGTALGIGHPFSATLDVIQEELARLDESGVRLLPVSQLIKIQNRSNGPWRASLSR